MSDNEPSAARILAFMMLDGMPPGSTNEDKSLRLNKVGFATSEISDLLGISPESAATTLSSAKRKAKAPAKKAAKKAPAKKA